MYCEHAGPILKYYRLSLSFRVTTTHISHPIQNVGLKTIAALCELPTRSACACEDAEHGLPSYHNLGVCVYCVMSSVLDNRNYPIG